MMFATVTRRFKQVLCLGLLTLTVFFGTALGWNAPAFADHEPSDVVQSRAKQELDRVAGSGTANEIEGRAKEGLGRVQRQVDQATSQIKGATRQAQGKVQKDVGRTQQAAEKAADSAQDSTQGFVESVKDFFGQ